MRLPRMRAVADDPKQLPADVRERAIEFMFELNNDPPDHPLTPEKAAGRTDYEIYKQNWRAGRIERREPVGHLARRFPVGSPPPAQAEERRDAVDMGVEWDDELRRIDEGPDPEIG